MPGTTSATRPWKPVLAELARRRYRSSCTRPTALHRRPRASAPELDRRVPLDTARTSPTDLHRRLPAPSRTTADPGPLRGALPTLAGESANNRHGPAPTTPTSTPPTSHTYARAVLRNRAGRSRNSLLPPSKSHPGPHPVRHRRPAASRGRTHRCITSTRCTQFDGYSRRPLDAHAQLFASHDPSGR